MANFAFPLPLSTDPLPYFARPGTILPTLPTPVEGSFAATPPNQQQRFGAIRPTAHVNNIQAGAPFILEQFYDLFWKDRLHIIEDSYEAGNVLSPTQNTFEIYNAGTKLPAKQVDTISIVGDTGITIVSGNVTTPFTLGLGQSEFYTYEIDSNGNPSITATIEYDFATGELLVHTITGTRSVIFNFEPQLPVREAFSWLTSLIQSVDGSEKRQAVRNLPRQELSYAFLTGDEVENAKLENFLRQPRSLLPTGVPVWLDGTNLSAPVAVNDLVINVTTTLQRDFRALGSQGLAVIRGPTTLEVFGVASFTNTTITAVAPILTAFPTGTEVYPVRLVDLQKAPGQSLWNVNARLVQLFFNVRVGADFGDETGFDVYKGVSVFNDGLETGGFQYERQWDWDQTQLGGPTSLTSAASLRRFAKIDSRFIISWKSRTEYIRIRNWLHARRGRQKSFWLATNRHDFILESNETVLGTVLKYEINDYVDVFANGEYIDVRVAYTDGTYDYREVSSVILSSGVREEITVDSAFSQIINTTNVRQVSLLIKHRLATDTIEFDHRFINEGQVALPITEIVV